MALYQRRLASSTRAVRCSLENRAKRLEVGLKKAQEIAQTAPPDLPDPDELEEMDDAERERIEEILEAISLAGNPEEVRVEIGELLQLAEQAQGSRGGRRRGQAVAAQSPDARTRILRPPRPAPACSSPNSRTPSITSSSGSATGAFRSAASTAACAAARATNRARACTPSSNSRKARSRSWWPPRRPAKASTSSVCNILFNYDIPWNPNRLEQRMGRIHRYGQRKDCLIFNFVATNTIEGRILQRLLEKLQEIRNALDDDAVFNVVGEVLPAAQIERVLRDYYAGHLGDADLEDRLLHNVDEARFRAICQNALEGLASKKLNLEMLIERRAQAQERRVVPETIARFMSRGGRPMPRSSLKPVASLPHAFDPGTHADRAAELRAHARLATARTIDQVSRAFHASGNGRGTPPGVGHARPSALRGSPPSRLPAGPGGFQARGLLL